MTAGPARFLVGIDLGTSNCALSYVDTADDGPATVRDLPLPQLRRPGEIAASPTLPSCLYLPADGEFTPDTLALPWASEASGMIIGEFARQRGAHVPGRAVTSAKSWLCHPGVDRTAPILPWGAPPDVPRVSPVDASTRYLDHLVRAWNHAHPDHPLADQDVVITVPASFDAVARELTVEAARRAGLPRCSLVEEPQAAFEACVHAAFSRSSSPTTSPDDFRDVRLVLVVDVGGGTTDFTLVEVSDSPNGPDFRRVAVGDHLMLGGDNMDAALARCAEERLSARGKRLDATQWSQLVQACRAAKESLLAPDGPDEVRVAVAARGSALLGGSSATALTRADAERLVLDGFLPRTGPDEVPARTPRAALQELGLPYARDAAISRQLAAFLHAHREAAWKALGRTPDGSANHGLPRPDALLLNGGAFNACPLVDRLLDVLAAWWPDAPPPRRLPSESLDLAVARGAVCHALARRGLARRITGGSSHAYFVGLEPKPGEPARALCVVPRGLEEGTSADLTRRTFRLKLGRPVQFPLFSSVADRAIEAGQSIVIDDSLAPLPPLQTSLQTTRGAGTAVVAVQLQSSLTPLGTLELACVAIDSGERWKLEFDLRAAAASTEASPESAKPRLPARFDQARAAIESVFPASRSDAASVVPPPRQLVAALERALGPRAEWPVPVLRELWATLWNGSARRRRTAEHERAFFHLAGFALRPGFGAPLDDWRCDQFSGLFVDGIQHVREAPVWIEFWVAWRRIAAGITPTRHRELWAFLEPHLAHRLDPKYPRHLGRPKGVQPEGLHEMVRLAAALEHLPADDKCRLGTWIAAQLADPAAPPGPWAWALGRLGARIPLYGGQHQVIPPLSVAPWLALLSDAHRRQVDGALFALAQIARLSGDRARDLNDAARHEVSSLLRESRAPESWQRLVAEVTVLERADEARALGDTLPLGLAG